MYQGNHSYFDAYNADITMTLTIIFEIFHSDLNLVLDIFQYTKIGKCQLLK